MPIEVTPTTGKRIHSQRNPTKAELLFEKMHDNVAVDTEEALAYRDMGAAEGGIVRHKRAKMVVMFKPIISDKRELLGYVRRETPEYMMGENMKEGWLAYCPDCGTDCSANQNDCLGRDKKAFRRCPECRKRIYDPGESNALDAEPEEGEIRLTGTAASTPESRTLHELLKHYAAFHPDEMKRKGLRPPGTGPTQFPDTRGFVQASNGGNPTVGGEVGNA